MKVETTASNAALLAESDQGRRARRLALHLVWFALLGDALVLLASMGLASWLRFETGLANYGVWGRGIVWTDYSRHVALGLSVFVILLVHFGVYDLSQMLRLRRVLVIVLKASVVWTIAYLTLSTLLRVENPVSRVYVSLAGGLALTNLTIWRYVFQKVVRREIVGRRLRQRILFVGWSEAAAKLVDAVTLDRCHFYEIVGVLTPRHGKFSAPPPSRVRQLGSCEKLSQTLDRDDVDIVMLADLEPSNEDMLTLATSCEKAMVDFKVIPSCFRVLLSGLNLESINGIPILGVSQLPLDRPLNVATKQVLDFLGGLVGCLISVPIVMVFGVLIYRESPGPIFYRQTRLGRDGKPFQIIKLRSMKLNAEADGKAGWSTPDDPRRLRIGSFMRRYNIDELPQFWNVLRGEMSLVGPRPERPEMIVEFKEEIPHYNARHAIKPGITGWAQVNGFRGDTDLRERIRCDLYYMENWSLFQDIQIMIMTILRNKNAC